LKAFCKKEGRDLNLDGKNDFLSLQLKKDFILPILKRKGKKINI